VKERGGKERGRGVFVPYGKEGKGPILTVAGLITTPAIGKPSGGFCERKKGHLFISRWEKKKGDPESMQKLRSTQQRYRFGGARRVRIPGERNYRRRGEKRERGISGQEKEQ